MALFDILNSLRKKGATLLFGPASSKGMYGVLPIDVLLSEKPTYAWQITSHPIEGGSQLSDSRIAQPVMVTLECVFTDVDYSASAMMSGALSKQLSFKSWQDKRDSLYEAMNKNILISATTTHNDYLDYMITNVTPDITADNSNAFFVTIELTEIKAASLEVTEVNPNDIPKQAAPKKEGGRADPKPNAEDDKINKAAQAKKAADEAEAAKTQGFSDPDPWLM